MKKTFISVITSMTFLFAAASPLFSSNENSGARIRRLTYSGNNVVQAPCLSEDGRWMIYALEIKEGEETTKSVRIMNIEDGKEKELFRDNTRKAPAPFQDILLRLGSKPPLLSGKAEVAVFSLSLAEPLNILDHYLAVVSSDGTNFWIIPFPIEALSGKDLKSLDFTSGNWERISNYALSSDGRRIACAVKGHLGPRRYGNPSGVIFLDLQTKKQRTILAPDFNGKEWIWPLFPSHPLSGGGWAFCLSGNGKLVVFGAQSSPDINDYDLYLGDWATGKMRRVTDFHDRWFSQADINHDGQRVVFFYNGKKKQGIGTYTILTDGSELKYLESKPAARIEFFDMSGSGRYILFKSIYKGMILDLDSGLETVAFDESTPGYSQGIMPMDFPQMPAFWGPRVMSFKGDMVLIVGPAEGKEKPEIFLLNIEMR